MEQAQRPNDVVVENVKVTAVTDGTEFFDDRLFIQLDCTPFASFDKEGKASTSNTFGINRWTLAKQIAPFSVDVRIAEGFAMGRAIKLPIFNFAISQGTISIKREYKFKGEPREDVATKDGKPAVYERDSWKTTIVAFTPNVDPEIKAVLQTLVVDPIDKERPKKVIDNPLNV